MAWVDRPTAFADESFCEHDDHGFYITVASIYADQMAARGREYMLALRGDRKVAKTHWTQMDQRDRVQATELVATLGGSHIVSVGTPVPLRRQERARAMCLTAMVPELVAAGVLHLVMEERESSLNARDVRTVAQARRGIPDADGFRITHTPGALEPMLWVADIVAGACRVAQDGDDGYRSILGERACIISVATGC